MYAEKNHLIDAPFAWKGSDMRHSVDWLRPFNREELAEIDSALQAVKQRRLDLFNIERDDFPLPNFSRALTQIAQELETGHGLIMLRGLPLTYSPQDLQIIYWGIGTHLGTALSQNSHGELLGTVTDAGIKVENTKRRGSKTSDGLDFHSDRCDVVGLLCIRKAKSGGASRVVSSAAIHNEVLTRRPDLIDVFYANWHHSWQGEEPPGQGRAYVRPIFGFRDGYFTGLFSPAYTRFAQEFPEVPRHTQAQREALELYSQLADELALDMQFEPGDIQLLNNHLIYHGRTEFDDDEDDEKKRLLLRLWLSVPGSRPLPMGEGYEVVLGGIEAGILRGGVPCRDGWWRDVTQFRAKKTVARVAQSGHAMFRCLSFAALVATCAFLLVGNTSAQTYPVKPVRLVVGYSPGGSADVSARVLAQTLTEQLGKSVVVENRPGASGAIATELVAGAPADGYTLLMMTAGDTVLPSLRKKLPFDIQQDFAPVSLVTVAPFVLVVNPSVPAHNLKELIDLARQHPGKLTYGSVGVGSTPYLSAEALKIMAKVDIMHVPYKGGADNVVANAKGEVDMVFASIPSILPLISADEPRLRPIAVTSTTRASLLPSLPTLSESGLPGYNRSSWFGVLAPAATPKEIITRLNEAIGKAVNAPEAKKMFIKNGLEPQTNTPEQFASYIKNELVQNEKLIKFIGVAAE